jgi:plastocyanin
MACHLPASPRIEHGGRLDMRRLALVVMSLGSIVGFGAGCGGGSSGYSGGNKPAACTATSATAATSVSLSGMEFVPSCVKISKGATVTFQNADSIAHTVTTDAGQPETFDSGPLAPARDFVHTFANAAETVHVHCSIHPEMTATIFVQ